MNLYEVSNNLNTSLVIEDIGVFLQARGGTDSSKVITANMHDMSSDLKRMVQLRWVTVSSRPAPVRRPVPVWPLSGFAHRPASTPSPEPSSHTQVLQDLSSITSSVARLDEALSEVLRLLRSSREHLPLNASSATSAISAPQDPIFLPSKIVPDAEVRMTVSSSESELKSFDESKNALAKLRKRK